MTKVIRREWVPHPEQSYWREVEVEASPPRPLQAPRVPVRKLPTTTLVDEWNAEMEAMYQPSPFRVWGVGAELPKHVADGLEVALMREGVDD